MDFLDGEKVLELDQVVVAYCGHPYCSRIVHFHLGRAEDAAQLVECWPSTREAPGSHSGRDMNQAWWWWVPVFPVLPRRRQEDQKFEVVLATFCFRPNWVL